MTRHTNTFSVDRCIACEHPISARSLIAREEAVAAHVAYVNTHLDRATDPHFAPGRLDLLVER